MNLGDPELELIDPTPNVHSLFVQFDKLFFTTTLSNRVVVKWSKRMYSCAGICSYERRSGFCNITLSEPLLKLRPRKDLLETLLHEMIHAYLFVTSNDRDRDGHGPKFQSHMSRINRIAGLNISIYHDFHDEVKVYRTHVWRCNGPCQLKKPYFGIIRRPMNRAPGPSDYWWNGHKAQCGGSFIKMSEPDKPVKKKVMPKPIIIPNYIPSNKIENNVPKTSSALKDCNCNDKPNSNKKGVNNGYFSPPTCIQKPLKNVNGQTVGGIRQRRSSADVIQTVRNVWTTKQFSITQTKEVVKASSPNLNPNKHKLDSDHIKTTPAKIKKIDDYFKSTASSFLKDIYGKDIELAHSDDGKKLVAVTDVNLVACPICNMKITKDIINSHLDECLNKDLVKQLTEDNIVPPIETNDKAKLKQIASTIPTIPKFDEIANFKINNNDIKVEIHDSIDLSFVDQLFNKPIKINSVYDTEGPSNPCKTDNMLSIVNNNKEIMDRNKSNFVGALPSSSTTVKVGNAPVIKKLIFNETIINNKCGDTVQSVVEPMNSTKELNSTFPIVKTAFDNNVTGRNLPDNFVDAKEKMTSLNKTANIEVKIEPGTSKDVIENTEQVCLCCNQKIEKQLAEHLDECTAFLNSFENQNSNNSTIVIDDDGDDILDESQIFNATGTKTPCPCCLQMVEVVDMNDHLDLCLKS